MNGQVYLQYLSLFPSIKLNNNLVTGKSNIELIQHQNGGSLNPKSQRRILADSYLTSPEPEIIFSGVKSLQFGGLYDISVTTVQLIQTSMEKGILQYCPPIILIKFQMERNRLSVNSWAVACNKLTELFYSIYPFYKVESLLWFQNIPISNTYLIKTYKNAKIWVS